MGRYTPLKRGSKSRKKTRRPQIEETNKGDGEDYSDNWVGKFQVSNTPQRETNPGWSRLEGFRRSVFRG